VGARPDALKIPGINWAVTAGAFTFPGKALCQQTFTILGLVTVKNVAKESERRKVIHPVVLYVIQKTFLETIGLDIDPIRPVRWQETTSSEDMSSALMVVEIRLECKAWISKMPKTEQEELLVGIDAGYALQPESGSDDVIDNLELGG